MQKTTLALAALLACASSAVAQTDAASATAAQAARPVSQVERRVIRMHNVPPQMIAWSLDARHNTLPAIYNIAWEHARAWMPESEMPTAFPSVPLPAGVEVVTADDKQNALIAYGTPGALDELEALVQKMDVPLRQVEIEAQFVEVSNDEVAKLKLNFQPVTAPPGVVGDVKAQVARLERVVGVVGILGGAAAGKMKILTAPRVVAVDNLPASIHTTCSICAPLQMSLGKRQFVTVNPQDLWVRPPMMGSALGVVALPHITGHGSIDLDLYAGRSLLLSTTENPFASIGRPKVEQNLFPQRSPFFLAGAGLIASRVTLNDGETAVFTGLPQQAFSSYFPGQKPTAKLAKDRQILVFVTTRIIRRLQAVVAFNGLLDR